MGRHTLTKRADFERRLPGWCYDWTRYMLILGNALRCGRLDLHPDALRMTATHRRRRDIRGEQGSLLAILVMPVHSETRSACDAPTREQRSRIIRVAWD